MVKLIKPSKFKKNKKASKGFAVGSFAFFTWAVTVFYEPSSNPTAKYMLVGLFGAFGLAWGYTSHCLWPYEAGDERSEVE